MTLRKFTIEEQQDGNYIGTLVRPDGSEVKARQGDPHTVIEMLITGDYGSNN